MQHLPFLGDLLKPKPRRRIAQQCNINQPFDRCRRFAETVDQLVDQVHSVFFGDNRRNLSVDINSLGEVFDIAFRDMRFQLDVDQAFGSRTDFRCLALLFGDSLGQKTQIHVISDRLHMSMLAGPEDVSGTADLQVTQGNAKTGPEFGKLTNRVQPLGCNLGQDFAALEGKIGIGPAAGTPDSSAQLVKLGKSQPVGIFNNQRVAVGDIDTCFNDGCTDQNINFLFHQLPPDTGKGIFRHFAVGDRNPCLRDHLLDFACAGVDCFGIVVQVVGLTAAAQFFTQCFDDNAGIVFQYIGLNRVAVLGCFLDDAHIPYSAHRHI